MSLTLAHRDDDPFRRLRPPQPTPYRDLCDCRDRPAVKLMPSDGFNPISCMACNREVDPETVGFPAELAEKIADWHADYRALDHLWLHGPKRYRGWARSQLQLVGSPVHQQGLELRRRLETYRPAYYWIFNWRQGTLAEVRQCPVCLAATSPHTGGKPSWWVCETCGIVADGSD